MIAALALRLAPWALAGLLALGGWWWTGRLQDRLAAAEAALAAAEREARTAEEIAAQARLARDVARASAEREARRAAELTEELRALEDAPDADDPVPALVSDTAARLLGGR